MDTSSWTCGQGGSGNVGDCSMQSSDWRVHLKADSRLRIENKIMDKMKNHIQVSGNEGLQKIAMSFEEEVYIAATSQSDYMRKICFKLLTIETKSQNPMPDANSVNPSYTAIGDSSMESSDWRDQLQADTRQKIVNKIFDTLKRHIPISGYEGLHELKKIAVRFDDKIFIAATSQSDYLRKISLKMLTMETRSQNSMPDAMDILYSKSGANIVGPTIL